MPLYADNMTDLMAKAISKRAAPGDPAELQREARGAADGCGQEGQQLDPQLPGAFAQAEAGCPDGDLVEVVGKAAQALRTIPMPGGSRGPTG